MLRVYLCSIFFKNKRCKRECFNIVLSYYIIIAKLIKPVCQFMRGAAKKHNNMSFIEAKVSS